MPGVMNARPRVSICMPVYNGAAFLRVALESVLNQTWSDFELVVVDNASTDATSDILKEYRDSRLVLMRNERNIGPISNFNRCLALARGDFVKLVCADDVLHPDCVERQIGAWDSLADDNIVLVNCGRRVIDADGRGWLVRSYGSNRGRIAGKEAIRRTIRSGGNRIGEPSATLLRTSVARRVGGFRSNHAFCMDLDLWCRMLVEGDMFAIPEALCDFRVSSSSWSVEIAKYQAREYRSFVDDIASDGRCGLTVNDRLVCNLNSSLCAAGRRVFYRVLSAARRSCVSVHED